MPKAIKITEENHRRLEMQYELEEDRFKDVIGIFLVADFSGSWVDVLSVGNLDFYFSRTGKDLENDWFEVARRG